MVDSVTMFDKLIVNQMPVPLRFKLRSDKPLELLLRLLQRVESCFFEIYQAVLESVQTLIGVFFCMIDGFFRTFF